MVIAGTERQKVAASSLISVYWFTHSVNMNNLLDIGKLLSVDGYDKWGTLPALKPWYKIKFKSKLS